MTSARTIGLSSGHGAWRMLDAGAAADLRAHREAFPSQPWSHRVALAPWIAPAVVAEYVHNFGIRLRRQFRGHTRHVGDASSIVRACIEACWNGRTFTASPGHFDM